MMKHQKLITPQIIRKYKVLVATAISAIVGIGIIVLCFVIAPEYQSGALSLLIGICGMLLGWIVGVALTPYNKEEQSKFSGYAKAIGVFASGYLVAKIDKVVEYLLSPENIFLRGSQAGPRILIFLASALLSLVTVFTHRQYIDQDRFERKRIALVDEEIAELQAQTLEAKPIKPSEKEWSKEGRTD
jgi:hypothetical protein